jgi:hypothetical protein
MYNFICSWDYRSLIKEGVKAMVTEGNDQIRLRAESFAREEMEGYLNSEYDVARVFNFKVLDFSSPAVDVKAGTLVIKDDGSQFVCILDATTANLSDPLKFVEDKLEVIKTYGATTVFTKGDTVVGSDQVKYLCIKDAPAGTNLFDSTYFWIKRNDLMVMIFCDIAIYHYHARINPNQIPQLRLDRYIDAVDKLKRIRRKELTPAIPRTDANGDGTPDSGAMIMVSQTKRQNGWE